MALADRVIVGLDNMVRRGMHRGQHMAQLMKIRQVIQRRIAALILQIAQKGAPVIGTNIE